MTDFLISWKGGGLKLRKSLPSCGSGFTTDKRGSIIVLYILIFMFMDSRWGRQKILDCMATGTS